MLTNILKILVTGTNNCEDILPIIHQIICIFGIIGLSPIFWPIIYQYYWSKLNYWYFDQYFWNYWSIIELLVFDQYFDQYFTNIIGPNQIIGILTNILEILVLTNILPIILVRSLSWPILLVKLLVRTNISKILVKCQFYQ